MTNPTTISQNVATRGKAATIKRTAVKEGWINVRTGKQPDGTFEVTGVAPNVPVKATPTKPATKAKKATPKGVKPVVAPKPAAKKGKAVKASSKTGQRLRKSGEVAKSTGVPGPRPVGTDSGEGIEATWCLIFAREATASKRLTDGQITAEMQENFPGRDSDVFARVGTVRAKFNRGGFACHGKPAKQCKAFKKGEPVAPKTPATPKKKASRKKVARKATGKKS